MARKINRNITGKVSPLKGLGSSVNLTNTELSHIIGQAAAIRYFDENSREDFTVINEILKDKRVKSWMDDAGKITWTDYKDWSGRHSNDSFLFSVHDSRLKNENEIKVIKGFVNIYSGHGEKYRAKRLIQLGILPKNKSKHILEISMAVRPLQDGQITGSGLMSSALRQSCLQVRSWLGSMQDSELVIYGFIDPKNLASIRAIEAAGFVKKGKAKYDSTASEDSLVYILSWRKLKKKLREKINIALRNKMKVITEPQKTNSHCGPSVIKALLGFQGINVSQDEVVEAALVKKTINEYGMQPHHLAKVVKKLGKNVKFWFKQEADINDLEKLIHKFKIPVGINWQGLFYDSVQEEKQKWKNSDRGHYSILVSVDKKRGELVIDDPYPDYFNTPRVFTYKWFIKRWHDSDLKIDNKKGTKSITKTKRFIFLIAPKKFIFPKNLGMKTANQLSELEKIEEIMK